MILFDCGGTCGMCLHAIRDAGAISVDVDGLTHDVQIDAQVCGFDHCLQVIYPCIQEGGLPRAFQLGAVEGCNFCA